MPDRDVSDLARTVQMIAKEDSAQDTTSRTHLVDLALVDLYVMFAATGFLADPQIRRAQTRQTNGRTGLAFPMPLLPRPLVGYLGRSRSG